MGMFLNTMGNKSPKLANDYLVATMALGLLVAGLIVLLCTNACQGGNMSNATELKFEEYYQRWINFINKPEIKISSRPSDYTDNEAYKKIVALGEPALVFIVEKLKNGQFFLCDAMVKITNSYPTTKKEYLSKSEQEKSKLWVEWWGKNKEKYIREKKH